MRGKVLKGGVWPGLCLFFVGVGGLVVYLHVFGISGRLCGPGG